MCHVNPITAAADAIPADPPLADPHGAAHVLVERQLAMLAELAEIGMTIAKAAERWALEAGEGAEAPVRPDGFRGDPGLVYSRAARAVRLTLMLQTRLLKDLPALGRAETLARMGAEQSRRERAHRLTVRAIRAEHDATDAVDIWPTRPGSGLGTRTSATIWGCACSVRLWPASAGTWACRPTGLPHSRHPRAKRSEDPRTQPLRARS